MDKISKDVYTFRSSYNEIPVNAENLLLASKQFDLLSITKSRLELIVREMIRFKHFINRHFYFKTGENNDMKILQSLSLLHQRFVMYPVPFEEFNEIFYREGFISVEKNGSAKRKLLEILSDSILVETVSSRSSTTIDPENLHQAVEFINELEISTKLVNDLHQSPLTIWGKKIRFHKLLETYKNCKTADAILRFEEKFGPVTNTLLKICREEPENLVFEFCEAASKKLDAQMNVAEITTLMREDPKNGNFMSFLVEDHEGNFCTVQTVVEKIVEKSLNLLNTWNKSNIQEWFQHIVSLRDKNEQTRIVKEDLCDVLAKICVGVYLRFKYTPRSTKLISVWLLIQKSFRQKGCLAEIQTGEGKTLIIAMMVIVRVLCGDDVDVITSSPILAQENLSDVLELYNIFGISVATNCDPEAERDEKIRKEKYKIDSMLLDKGENILYLSHNIPDLRYICPIFVEIWNAVHAPDVLEGRPEDVSLVAKFIKERIKNGDISFPSSLSKFIEAKLLVCIQNAFLAKNMKENDPYVLSDVDKKGPNVVIMDKDTGVEQVNMNWSNGLHQFIQLKHNDRLTSESLKAVFMSNISYFRKFKGKLFGITGTLGSTTERELLSKCYDVDFFAVPRFQSRGCIEEEVCVLPDESTWANKIQEILQSLVDRAVLIICENVDSVDKIVKKLGKKPSDSQRVVPYKSSFDEQFRGDKKTIRLDKGYILVATNIAGRGTDWVTTQAVEEAGGLHVILSYMPGNIRIEEQAFGRTARNGKPGSVQYVVIHTGTEEITVNALRRVRDECESKRLDNSRIKNIPRIEIEEKLCKKFYEILSIVKSKLKETDTNVEQLHIENLANRWAMWLDSMSENIKLIHINGEAPILEYFAEYKSDIISKIGDVSKFESGPVEFIKLGKLYEARGDFCLAQPNFDKIIYSAPNHCDVAHYYKAALLLKQNLSDINVKRQAIHLKFSYRLLKKKMNQLVSSPTPSS
ncbi:unnamed protein product, partial [Allacma fusca]